MTNSFKKLMRKQIQENLNDYTELAQKAIPKKGWIKTIRQALGMSSETLAKIINCSRANITSLEQREQKKTITLDSLEKVAIAMNCKLVYCLVPLKPVEQILKDQATVVAKHRIKSVNHSMALEDQGLTYKQLKQLEKNLIHELLEGSPKNLWDKNEI